jgi:hypothetical protein
MVAKVIMLYLVHKTPAKNGAVSFWRDFYTASFMTSQNGNCAASYMGGLNTIFYIKNKY